MTTLYIVRSDHDGDSTGTAVWADTADAAIDRVYFGYPPASAAAAEATESDTVRLAAEKIRRRAEPAFPGPWHAAFESCDEFHCNHGSWAYGIDFGVNAMTGEPDETGAHRVGTIEAQTETVRHMALWSPAPALAVAAWLDSVVANPPVEAVAVAEAILRKPA